MKILINILILLAIAALAYLLVTSISEPIKFRGEKSKRENRVSERLTHIRTSQEMYRDITGKFASNFDTLSFVLKNDSIPFVQIFEDPEDPTNEDKFVYKTLYTNAHDSIRALNINLDSLRYVPYAPRGTTFSIDADTTTYQKTNVWVTEVSTRYKDFMGPFADLKFTKYDDRYDPNRIMKFGDMGSPSLSGNWE